MLKALLHLHHTRYGTLLAQRSSASSGTTAVRRVLLPAHTLHTPHPAPGYHSHSVAEVVLMMILMLSRRADEARAVFEAREPIGRPVGRELYGKTLGIVGMGKVGTCLAAAARGLGMEVGFTLLECWALVSLTRGSLLPRTYHHLALPDLVTGHHALAFALAPAGAAHAHPREPWDTRIARAIKFRRTAQHLPSIFRQRTTASAGTSGACLHSSAHIPVSARDNGGLPNALPSSPA